MRSPSGQNSTGRVAMAPCLLVTKSSAPLGGAQKISLQQHRIFDSFITAVSVISGYVTADVYFRQIYYGRSIENNFVTKGPN